MLRLWAGFPRGLSLLNSPTRQQLLRHFATPKAVKKPVIPPPPLPKPIKAINNAADIAELKRCLLPTTEALWKHNIDHFSLILRKIGSFPYKTLAQKDHSLHLSSLLTQLSQQCQSFIENPRTRWTILQDLSFLHEKVVSKQKSFPALYDFLRALYSHPHLLSHPPTSHEAYRPYRVFLSILHNQKDPLSTQTASKIISSHFSAANTQSIYLPCLLSHSLASPSPSILHIVTHLPSLPTNLAHSLSLHSELLNNSSSSKQALEASGNSIANNFLFTMKLLSTLLPSLLGAKQITIANKCAVDAVSLFLSFVRMDSTLLVTDSPVYLSVFTCAARYVETFRREKHTISQIIDCFEHRKVYTEYDGVYKKQVAHQIVGLGVNEELFTICNRLWSFLDRAAILNIYPKSAPLVLSIIASVIRHQKRALDIRLNGLKQFAAVLPFEPTINLVRYSGLVSLSLLYRSPSFTEEQKSFVRDNVTQEVLAHMKKLRVEHIASTSAPRTHQFVSSALYMLYILHLRWRYSNGEEMPEVDVGEKVRTKDKYNRLFQDCLELLSLCSVLGDWRLKNDMGIRNVMCVWPQWQETLLELEGKMIGCFPKYELATIADYDQEQNRYSHVQSDQGKKLSREEMREIAEELRGSKAIRKWGSRIQAVYAPLFCSREEAAEARQRNFGISHSQIQGLGYSEIRDSDDKGRVEMTRGKNSARQPVVEIFFQSDYPLAMPVVDQELQQKHNITFPPRYIDLAVIVKGTFYDIDGEPKFFHSQMAVEFDGTSHYIYCNKDIAMKIKKLKGKGEDMALASDVIKYTPLASAASTIIRNYDIREHRQWDLLACPVRRNQLQHLKSLLSISLKEKSQIFASNSSIGSDFSSGPL